MILFAQCKYYSLGDEIFEINGQPTDGLTHAQAIGLFKQIKVGDIILLVGHRTIEK